MIAHTDVTRLLSHTEVSVVSPRQSLIWFTHFVGKKAHLHQPQHNPQLSEEEQGGRGGEEEETTLSAWTFSKDPLPWHCSVSTVNLYYQKVCNLNSFMWGQCTHNGNTKVLSTKSSPGCVIKLCKLSDAMCMKLRFKINCSIRVNMSTGCSTANCWCNCNEGFYVNEV